MSRQHQTDEAINQGNALRCRDPSMNRLAMAKVLVADDEHAICEAFAMLLEREGHEPLTASTGSAAIEIVERESPSAVFLDVQMPGMSGLEALRQIHESHPHLPVIVITAHGSVETAMAALRLGAFDYLGKPLELPQIRAVLKRALYQSEPASPVIADADPAPEASSPQERIIGTSRAMQEVFKMVGLLTGNDLTVLITGESGVGKDLVARSLHRHGPRCDQPFVAVNCAAIPEQLIESELFGHEKGAFTGAERQRIGRFEAAGTGTLFLDEISELPYHLQAKLLRVLQDRSCERVGGNDTIPVRARIIAATNHRLDDVAAGRPFRDDLYYRLSLVTLHIPPLRQRREDIAELSRHFLARAARELGRPAPVLQPEALERLVGHPWPGNVRELEHTLQRSLLMARGGALGPHDLVFDDTLPTPGIETSPTRQLESAARVALAELIDTGRSEGHPYRELLASVERVLIDEALVRCNGNQVAASELLGINRTTLRKKSPDD